MTQLYWINQIEQALPGFPDIKIDLPAERFVAQATEQANFAIERLPALRDCAVADIGCGSGKLAVGLSRVAGLCYRGIDLRPRYVEFARRLFHGYPDYEFQVVDVYNERYGKDGRIRPQAYTLPWPDRSVDLVLCYSLFTHFEHFDDIRHYVREIVRILIPGGAWLATWLTSPPLALEDSSPARAIFSRGRIEDLYNGECGATFQVLAEDGAGAAGSQWRRLALLRP